MPEIPLLGGRGRRTMDSKSEYNTWQDPVFKRREVREGGSKGEREGVREGGSKEGREGGKNKNEIKQVFFFF